MQTPSNMDNHQDWGGQRFQTILGENSTNTSQQTFVGRERRESRIGPSSQAGILASNSDDLFYPVMTRDGPSSQAYTLPNVPPQPHPHFPAHNHHLPSRYMHHRSSLSSYNNPTFAIPPPPPRDLPYSPSHVFPPASPTLHGPPLGIPTPPIAHQLYAPLPHRPSSIHSVHSHLPGCTHCTSHSSSHLPTAKTLPTVSHIPLLTSKSDFPAWDEGVMALIHANGLTGHILDPSEPVDPLCPDRTPTPLPILPPLPSPQELRHLNCWWNEDNIAQHILISRLGTIPRGLLPSPNIVTRTALSIYKMLRDFYGTNNHADCVELLNSLHTSFCTAGRVQEYVSKWRTGISRLHSAMFLFNIRTCISLFVRGLPLISAFTSLRASLPDRLALIAEDDMGAFITISENVLHLDTIFRSASHVHSSRSQRPSATTTAPLPPPTPLNVSSPAVAVDSAPRGSSKTCSNCKSRGLRCSGHTVDTCFQPGGGMEGRRDEYLNNRGKIHAMFADCLDNALHDMDIPPDPHDAPLSPSSFPSLPSTLDDVDFLPPLANLCVPTFPANTDVDFNLYFSRAFPASVFPQLAFTTVDFKNSALISLVSLYNALLDSGCTHHIIRDRSLFSNFVSSTISVGTANCGSLEALGTGDVKFRYQYGTQHVAFTLRGCLYAPSAPINLLSIGALVEHGMSCLFSPGGVTKVFFPDDHPLLPGLAFTAHVTGRLSFLNLNFLPSSPAVLPTAFPAHVSPSTPAPPYSFPRLRLDSMLWHRRFGHIGMDATRAALTKDYVTGVQYDGPILRDRCIACIVGKSPQCSYSTSGNRATKLGELLHMDLCGPYPVQGPRGERYFFNILDDKSNFGFTFGLRQKSDAFAHYLATEAFLEHSGSVRVLAIRCGSELELTAGKMRDHLIAKGVVIQRTVPYAHEQNGKSERYIRTMEEGGQALLADSGLPMSFWLDAVLTRQYLCNRLPTSTLPNDVTPFESFTNGRKPDLSHLRVWGCDCYVAIPDELRPKASFKRFRAIFVGYEKHRKGWRVRDLHGKYSFSNDVIFNENVSGRLGVPRQISSPSSTSPRPSSPHLLRTHPHARTAAGEAYDAAVKLRELRRTSRTRSRLQDGGAMRAVFDDVVHGGAQDRVDVVVAVDDVVAVDGVVAVDDVVVADDIIPVDDVGVAPSQMDLASVSVLFPADVATLSLAAVEVDILRRHLLPSLSTLPLIFLDSDLPPTLPLPTAFQASSTFMSHRPFDLTKSPLSYSEAIARSDAPVWRAAMDREKASLDAMGAFEEVALPPGERAIGLKWVFAHKTDAAGINIVGKEKARVVAQGFNQRPGQFDETYAPVAKMASVRVLLAWAAARDLDIFQFDCKTAFLHAKLRHPVYARQIPGYPLANPKHVLRLLVALYGLRQSAFEFYMLLLSLFLDLGLIRCDVDHGVFMGEWTSPPHPSIPMPLDGSPLVLFVPIHVDDGLGITNSPPLYTWFLTILSKRLHIVDLGPCSKFLSILILRDRPNRRIWLSSHLYVSELLDEWNLSSCKPASTPFPSNLSDLPDAPPNSLPNLSDVDLLPKYQRIVGCLLYLAVSTRPDIAYYAMWFGQFNANPSRRHFLAAKHVLRYLSGTRTLALSLGSPSPAVPSTLRGYLQTIGCSDADWASDAVDRKSISGYSFYFEGSLVSWSAVKQKSIALSSTEAEYYAMTHAFKEALWLRTFLSSMKFPIPRPFPILSDNQAACSLSSSPAISARSKHIDILSVPMFKMVLFLLLGFLLVICQLIFLPKLCLFLLFPVIAMFLVFLFLLL